MWIGLLSSMLFCTIVSAQENSPYSRYGLGDLSPNQNITARGMGGISAGYSDFQSINFVNPASLGKITNTIFDIGTEVDIRTLKSLDPAKKFTATNAIFSYLQLGFPVASQKMIKKNKSWGVSFGLRPISKINYKIEKNERLPGIDSINTLYEGSGGLNQVFVGTGLKIKNLSLGFNVGYMFGNKNFSTRRSFISDTIAYYKSNSATQSHFGGVFVNGALQYDIKINESSILRIGAYGSLPQTLKAKRDDIRETFTYISGGGTFKIDSIYEQKDIKGTVEYPSNFGVGFTFTNKNWLIGMDYETTQWNNYRFFNTADEVQNSFTVKAGAQYYPAKENTASRKYFSFVKYRAGLFYGPDHIKVNNTNRPGYGFTVGTGMPLTSLQRLSYAGEYVLLNTALEIGGRGNKNTNLQEGIVRFNVGLSMNAHWFRKPKYN
ncbi:MAG: hypothetical protein IPJ81_15180 [Chitinophagaceae bacterium]|nr:hypothetical protein [Chitinophagaceae bacterium]